MQTIVRYLEAPESFTITEWVSFEDFIIKEYCWNLLGNFLNINADCCQGQSNEEELKTIILEEFGRLGRQRQRRIKKESYLNLTFSEDILRSRLELMKVIEEKGIMWKTKKKVLTFKHCYLISFMSSLSFLHAVISLGGGLSLILLMVSSCFGLALL